MGGFIRSLAPKAPPPPPIISPVVQPSSPEEGTQEIKNQDIPQKKKIRRKTGRAATILTSNSGVAAPAHIGRKILLGG